MTRDITCRCGRRLITRHYQVFPNDGAETMQVRGVTPYCVVCDQVPVQKDVRS